MSKKVTMFFKKAHGIYVPGDIAGFDADQARQLGSAAEKYDPKKHSKTKPTAEAFDAEMAARTSELDAREAALAEREAALETSADDQTKTGKPTTKKPTTQKAKETGAPPERGNN